MVRELTVMSARLNECLLTAASHVQVARLEFSVAMDMPPRTAAKADQLPRSRVVPFVGSSKKSGMLCQSHNTTAATPA